MREACRDEVGAFCARYAKIPHRIDPDAVYLIGRAVWGGKRTDGWTQEGTVLRPLGDRPSYPRLRQLAAWLSVTGLGMEQAIERVAAWVLWHIWLPPSPATDSRPCTTRTKQNNPYI